MAFPDPTYIKSEIEANPVWFLAWQLSEIDNDMAPIGWRKYIAMASWLIATYHIVPKEIK